MVLIIPVFTKEESSLIESVICGPKTCGSDLPFRGLTITEKLEKLAKEVPLSGLRDRYEENEDELMLSLEKLIPLLLEKEHHNYIVIDSFDVSVKNKDGIEPLWSFRNSDNIIDMETYKKWFEHFQMRSWPADVGDTLLEFSANSAKLCYNGYTIVALKNIKYTDDRYFNSVLDSLDEIDASERRIISKFLLVKIDSEYEKLLYNEESDEDLYGRPFTCLDPDLPGVHIESILQTSTESICTNNTSSEVSLENGEDNSKDTYTLCQMDILLASRNHLVEVQPSNLCKMVTIETFLFKCIGESENEKFAFSKVIYIAKKLTDKFYIAEEDTLTNSADKEFVEVGEESEVNELVHSIYHKCLKYSNEITVFHKFATTGFKKIFNINLKGGSENLSPEAIVTSLEEGVSESSSPAAIVTSLEEGGSENSSPAAIVTSLEEIIKDKEKGKSKGSMISVSYIEMPEKTLQNTELVSGETDKARCLPYENVVGWFEAKKKYNIELKTGIQHMIENKKKGRRHILIGYSSYQNILKELKRLKRLAEESAEPDQSNKRPRTEITNLDSMNLLMESEASTSEPHTHDTSNTVIEHEQTDLMEVDNPLNDNINEGANPQGYDKDSNCEVPGQNTDLANTVDFSCLLEEDDVHMLDDSWPDFLLDTVDIIIDFGNEFSQPVSEKPNSFDDILDLCLKNKEQLGSSFKDI